MTDEQKTAEPKTPGGNVGNSTPKITRRRFTKAGALAPVVMTLSSRPVWGQTCSPSAVGSLSHISHHPNFKLDQCEVNCAPEVWLGLTEAYWLQAGYSRNTVMNTVFSIPTTGCASSPPEEVGWDLVALAGATLTFETVLSTTAAITTQNNQKLLTEAVRTAARQTIAALLNAGYSDYLNGSSLEPYPFYSPDWETSTIKAAFQHALADYCQDGSTNSLSSLSFPNNGFCFFNTLL